MADKLLFEVPSLPIAIIGWMATALVIMNRPGLQASQRRSLLFSSWILWMTVSFISLVVRGLLTTEEAAAGCGVASLTMGLIIWLSGPRVRQTR
jgi:hypothetical protein